jgi:hypothetical protein
MQSKIGLSRASRRRSSQSWQGAGNRCTELKEFSSANLHSDPPSPTLRLTENDRCHPFQPGNLDLGPSTPWGHSDILRIRFGAQQSGTPESPLNTGQYRQFRRAAVIDHVEQGRGLHRRGSGSQGRHHQPGIAIPDSRRPPFLRKYVDDIQREHAGIFDVFFVSDHLAFRQRIEVAFSVAS